jgi:hypothetical protein
MVRLTNVAGSTGCCQPGCCSPGNAWSKNFMVVTGNSALLNSGGYTNNEYGQSDEAYADLIKVLDKALEAPPEATLAIDLKVVRQP